MHFNALGFPLPPINNKAANCIDGTILFASLLENIGIRAFIVLVPGHALVGWRPLPNSTKIMLLETTQISSENYETAIKSGQRSLNRGLAISRNISKKPNLTLEEALQRGIIRFIDVSLMREKEHSPATYSVRIIWL